MVEKLGADDASAVDGTDAFRSSENKSVLSCLHLISIRRYQDISKPGVWHEIEMSDIAYYLGPRFKAWCRRYCLQYYGSG